MKIYTKGGDKGRTSLIGGERVAKTDSRVEAYGTVDELTAYTALLADMLMEDERMDDCTQMLRHIESHLMTVASLLAVGEGGQDKVAALNDASVEMLEQWIDSMQEVLPAIDKFTIPGGDRRLSMCHVCRTVCRRAERAALRADQEHGVAQSAKVYLNRLSDLYYTLGRTITLRAQVEEILWRP
jgi:cob(I)alamin adenosyltransferase